MNDYLHLPQFWLTSVRKTGTKDVANHKVAKSVNIFEVNKNWYKQSKCYYLDLWWKLVGSVPIIFAIPQTYFS